MSSLIVKKESTQWRYEPKSDLAEQSKKIESDELRWPALVKNVVLIALVLVVPLAVWLEGVNSTKSRWLFVVLLILCVSLIIILLVKPKGLLSKSYDFRRSKNYFVDKSGIKVEETPGKIKSYPWSYFMSYFLPEDVADLKDNTEYPNLYEINTGNRLYLRFRGVRLRKNLTIFCLPSDRVRLVEVVSKYVPHVAPWGGLFRRSVTTDIKKAIFWKAFLFYLVIGLALFLIAGYVIFKIAQSM